jgi:hypothetical protein
MKAAPGWILGIAFVSSCAGRSEPQGAFAGAPSGAASSGGADAAGGLGTTAGSESTTGSVARAYVPDHPNQPPEGDGRVTGGSFEQSQGAGWDTCFSRNAGGAYTNGEPEASDGEHCFTFDSRRACVDSPACRPTGGDAQFGFWLGSVVPAGDPVHLYFDVINFGSSQPNGELAIDAVGSLCESREVLAKLPLSALALDTFWQTRCVSFLPGAPFSTFGVYVTGSSFYMGLDTFRFGPPCHD